MYSEDAGLVDDGLVVDMVMLRGTVTKVLQMSLSRSLLMPK